MKRSEPVRTRQVADFHNAAYVRAALVAAAGQIDEGFLLLASRAEQASTVYANFAALRLLDLGRDHGRADAPFEHFDPIERRRLEAVLKRVLHDDPVPGRIETFLVRRDGTRAALDVSIHAVAAQGQPTASVILRDVTDRRTFERQEQALREEEENFRHVQRLDRARIALINRVAHEVATPLTPIKMQAYLLLSEDLGPINERQRSALRMIERNIERFADTVGHLAEIAADHPERAPLHGRPHGLHAAIEAAVGEFRRVAEQKEIAIDIQDNDLNVTVRMEKSQVVRILKQLLDNAIKFTPPGGRIRIHAYARGKDAVVEVTDTGMGFEPADAPREFNSEHGALAERPGEPRPKGNGLALARLLIERSGGRAWRTSRGSDRGSTFAFRLPLAH